VLGFLLSGFTLLSPIFTRPSQQRRSCLPIYFSPFAEPRSSSCPPTRLLTKNPSECLPRLLRWHTLFFPFQSLCHLILHFFFFPHSVLPLVSPKKTWSLSEPCSMMSRSHQLHDFRLPILFTFSRPCFVALFRSYLVCFGDLFNFFFTWFIFRRVPVSGSHKMLVFSLSQYPFVSDLPFFFLTFLFLIEPVVFFSPRVCRFTPVFPA